MQASSDMAMSVAPGPARGRELSLVAIAAAALLLGVFVYAAGRSAQPVYFLPAAFQTSLHAGLLHAVSGQLPSFVHVYAFILLSVAVAPASMRLGSICAAWTSIDALFELAQHPAVRRPLLDAWPTVLDPVPVIGNLPNYLRLGTFDPLDLLAVALGACAAWATCRALRPAEAT